MIWTAGELQQSDPYVVLHVQYIDSVDKHNDQKVSHARVMYPDDL